MTMIAWIAAAALAPAALAAPPTTPPASAPPTSASPAAPPARPASAGPAVGPDLPAGSSSAFQRAAVGVQEHLQAGRWDAATRAAGRLPGPKLRIAWDESDVPADLRAAYRQARDRAIQGWLDRWRDLDLAVLPAGARGGDLRIGFTDRLPADADAGGPRGAAFLFSEDPADPRVEAVVALHRTAQGLPATPRDVRNEVAFAIGAALGLERTPRSGGVMDRHDRAYGMDTAVLPGHIRTLREVFEVSDRLRQAAARRERLIPPRPAARLDVVEIRHGDVGQGDVVPLSFGVANTGNATLRFEVVPDCGCFGVASVRELAPGESTIVQVRADTTEFPGPFDKSLYLMSNDVDVPVRRIPVRFQVEPRYRFLAPGAPPVRLVPDEGLREELFLAVSARRPFRVTAVRAEGTRAMVEFEPWSGRLADQDLQDPERDRTGYRIKFLTFPDVPLGRAPLTIVAVTDDPELGEIRHTLNLQRGIVPLPANLFLGELGREPVRAWVLFSRPGRPFRVRAARIDHPNLRAEVAPPGERGDVRVFVIYDGRGDVGDVAATLEVDTDDPAQPTMRVPLRGTVR